ncbi:MAG: response regulator [Bacteroidetes bacterium]|nr:response regulator [Bacteroidota bacterium]
MGDHTINWTGKSILVVEDDHINFNYLDILLKPTKAKILHAENGLIAVELCRMYSEINVVLMDMRMPVLNGLDATRQIIAMRSGMPVIAQTAYADEEDQKAAFSAGCCEFLAKPIRANEMLDLIKKYILPE